MSTSQHDLDTARAQGKERGLAGAPANEAPDSLRAEWLAGWAEGTAIRHADNARQK